MKTLTWLSIMLWGFALSAQAQPQQQSGIPAFYQQLLAGMRNAKSKEDIAKMLEATDTNDWISIDAVGRRTSRADAQKAMEGMIAAPSEKRVLPDLEVIWLQEAGGKATVLMWVSVRAKITDHQGQFGEKGKVYDTALGSLVRDSLILTPKGWRRTKQEKLFPDQPLSLDGIPRIHIPGTSPLPQRKK